MIKEGDIVVVTEDKLNEPLFLLATVISVLPAADKPSFGNRSEWLTVEGFGWGFSAVCLRSNASLHLPRNPND